MMMTCRRLSRSWSLKLHRRKPRQVVGCMATKLPLPQISPVRSATGGSPLPSPSALANYSSSGQSDSGDSSALSQRTVIEVSAQKPTSPQQQQQQPASYDSMFPARRPSQTSGLRQPTAIPKLAPTPPPAQLAQPSNLAAAALNGGEKSLSASALPAPRCSHRSSSSSRRRRLPWPLRRLSPPVPCRGVSVARVTKPTAQQEVAAAAPAASHRHRQQLLARLCCRLLRLIQLIRRRNRGFLRHRCNSSRQQQPAAYRSRGPAFQGSPRPLLRALGRSLV
ncbi:hypothetical protein BOX15_Mlig014762g2 [Macrostomum lignano]|uniref:Uncharacterized protein n=1 Tax=Macrostomum lignano TaxID=282301 RepID=A0A267FUT8_9PLAT|nr:hypothetical protein BOX15_Mlig014762g2 [Macrostomum lignano]